VPISGFETSADDEKTVVSSVCSTPYPAARRVKLAVSYQMARKAG
jgi:hypothetical protein